MYMYSWDLQRVTTQLLSHASRNRALTTSLKFILGWLRRNLSSLGLKISMTLKLSPRSYWDPLRHQVLSPQSQLSEL